MFLVSQLLIKATYFFYTFNYLLSDVSDESGPTLRSPPGGAISHVPPFFFHLMLPFANLSPNIMNTIKNRNSTIISGRYSKSGYTFPPQSCPGEEKRLKRVSS